MPHATHHNQLRSIMQVAIPDFGEESSEIRARFVNLKAPQIGVRYVEMFHVLLA